MKGRDLSAEMDSAQAGIRQCHLERLRDIGISYTALASLNAEEPTVGVATVRTEPAGFFVFDNGGEQMVVQAICVHPEARELGDSGIIDLLAWRSSDPARWWWRCGSAFALGWEILAGDEAVPVVATPCDWLAASGDALCILDWSSTSPAWPLVRAGPPLTFTDEFLRQRVRSALVQSAPMPAMEITDAA